MLRIDLAVQHALPPRHFFFLTNTALHTLVRDPICRAIIRSIRCASRVSSFSFSFSGAQVMVRPIDQLYRILAESGGHLTHSIEVREASSSRAFQLKGDKTALTTTLSWLTHARSRLKCRTAR
jgi:hypothetical protein